MAPMLTPRKGAILTGYLSGRHPQAFNRLLKDIQGEDKAPLKDFSGRFPGYGACFPPGCLLRLGMSGGQAKACNDSQYTSSIRPGLYLPPAGLRAVGRRLLPRGPQGIHPSPLPERDSGSGWVLASEGQDLRWSLSFSPNPGVMLGQD